jgi:hypothetical protein
MQPRHLCQVLEAQRHKEPRIIYHIQEQLIFYIYRVLAFLNLVEVVVLKCLH